VYKGEHEATLVEVYRHDFVFDALPLAIIRLSGCSKIERVRALREIQELAAVPGDGFAAGLTSRSLSEQSLFACARELRITYRSLGPSTNVWAQLGGSLTEVPEEEPQAATVARYPDHAVLASEPAAAPATSTPAALQPGPSVVLGEPGRPCYVRGREKPPLTDGTRAVIEALLDAGSEGLSKEGLQGVRPSALRMLKDLREDPDWQAVILMARRTNGRYRIVP
jgi:hypothetical protein